eukprot:TRINITY_DN480_c0_g1_i1.p1 TRINITY_DN480_c0_g1~~TRINITY_DN480_c0_g1_i1.p1  ORF type:complete len:329 (-),score=105.78 TRINITY_DN480_c0_g1_i1:309-1295(-)
MGPRTAFALFSTILCVVTAYDCQFYDEFTDTTFDLSQLQNSDTDYLLDHGGVTYWINLCQPSTSAQCVADTAVCVVPNNGDLAFSIGNTLSMMSYSPGNSTAVLALLFSNGDIDEHRKIPRSMQINFVCGDDLGDYNEAITLASKDVAADFWTFQWETSLVCPPNSTNGTDYSSSSSITVDPFLVTLTIVVPVLLLVLFIVSVAFCCYCCRRNRRDRERARLAALPTTVKAEPKAAAKPEMQPLMQQQQSQMAAVAGPYGVQYTYGAMATPYGFQPIPMMAPPAPFGAGNVQADGTVYMPFMYQAGPQGPQMMRPYATLVEEVDGDRK